MLTLPTRPSNAGAAETGAASSGTASLGIEEGSYHDYTLYIRVREGMAYHGVYTGTYPPPPHDAPPFVAWSGNVLRLPGLSHRGTDDPAESARPPLPERNAYVFSIQPSGSFIEIPLSFQEIPASISSIEIYCNFSNTAQGIRRFSWSEDAPFSGAHNIGYARGGYYQRDVSGGDWSLSTTTRLPINLRPFMVPTDIKGVVCDVKTFHDSFVRLSNPEDPGFVPGMAAAPGSSPVDHLTVNVEY